MSTSRELDRLIDCYRNSPQPSFKVSTYFRIYAELFSHLVGTKCTFIETGIFDGGSLFMWRSWLGDNARIIGFDLNPTAKKWEEHGFEIFIGDQGDPECWSRIFEAVGGFDALLDDGGHQSFQQIVTLTEALKAGKDNSIIVIEDTMTSFMKEFSRHRQHSFLEYAKDATDTLTAKTGHLWPNQLPPIDNPFIMAQFRRIHSIEFFSNIVAFKLDEAALHQPELIRNKPPNPDTRDFRYDGLNEGVIDWPDPFTFSKVVVRGGSA